MFAHLDADSFFASVLQRKHPRLRGKPLLALGMGGGCVIAASYEAKATGVKTGMPLKEALKLCPDALQIPSDFQETGLASEQIEMVVRDHCPVIEQMSIDEWFLDLATLPGGDPFDPYGWAVTLQRDVQRSTGLSVSVGVAPSKLLAKMASEYRKPAGVTVVGEATATSLAIPKFLQDRPAAAIPGIGRKRQVHAVEHKWESAWDIANADHSTIKKLFGKPGLEMQRELLGEAVHPVISEAAPPKSVSRCRSFRPMKNPEMLWAHIMQHLSYCVLRMRRHELACTGIWVWLRDGDYKHQSTTIPLPQALDTEEQLTPYARRCFAILCKPHRNYTQAGLALVGLKPVGAAQASLFEEPKKHSRRSSLQSTLDDLRSRYGRDIICRGSNLLVNKQHRKSFDVSVFEEGLVSR